MENGDYRYLDGKTVFLGGGGGVLVFKPSPHSPLPSPPLRDLKNLSGQRCFFAPARLLSQAGSRKVGVVSVPYPSFLLCCGGGVENSGSGSGSGLFGFLGVLGFGFLG